MTMILEVPDYALDVLARNAGNGTRTTTNGTGPAPTVQQAERDLAFMREKNRAIIELLDSWAAADEDEVQEQKETWAILEKGLKENPLRFRTVFSEEDLA